jgi:hypothetical protein
MHTRTYLSRSQYRIAGAIYFRLLRLLRHVDRFDAHQDQGHNPSPYTPRLDKAGPG